MGPNCTIQAQIRGASTNGTFSMCTAEGIQSGKAIAGIDSSVTKNLLLSNGSCMKDADCKGAGMMCSYSTRSTRHVCVCNTTTGVDECSLLGSCVPTPCRACQNCLNTVSRNFIQGQVCCSSAGMAYASAELISSTAVSYIHQTVHLCLVGVCIGQTMTCLLRCTFEGS